jgi:excisionase family DNA binding protein
MSQPNDLLTVAEVAHWLRVDVRTIYRWLRAGQLPSLRVGRGWRVRRRDVEAWMRQRTSHHTRK